jgi:glycosyltransferase involved in cell wall biosynthesis
MDALKVCFVGTYPPTRCGLATFTQSLMQAMTPPGTTRTAGVVRVLEAPEPPRGTEVVAEWIASDPASRDRALAAMRTYDVAILQHEYGIYPGADGEDVVGFLRACPIPAVVVLHTVLVEPTLHQRKVLDQVMELADAVVVPTHAARARLLAVHDVLPERVMVVPHGAVSNVGPAVEKAAEPMILTWGLIGPGKGLEYGIEAMRYLQDLETNPVYTIAGGTHPKVKAREGESYRDGLMKQASDLGVSDSVVFEDRYLDPTALRALARAADVILLPYESREQICSGVLVEAISSGTPVVATAFPHAVELLSSACGIVVPHQDPEAMARAIRRLLTDDALAGSMQEQARREAARHTWSSVGRQYTALIHRAIAEREAA